MHTRSENVSNIRKSMKIEILLQHFQVLEECPTIPPAEVN
jgi:hypothetical protein